VNRRIIAVGLLLLLPLFGCHQGQNSDPNAASGQAFKSYKLRGKIVSINADRGEVTVDHQAIPGFMEAMTMAYKLREVKKLSDLHPGDQITADVLVFDDPKMDYLLDSVVVVAQAKPK
jgi:protein SCO1/2